MNQEVKEKWVAALRSGKYEQGRHSLHGERNSYCCLGVLCDISGLGKWGELVNNRPYMVDNDHDSSDLLRAVAEWAGLGDGPYVSIPDVKVDVGEFDGRVHVAAYNDQGATFGQIADAIEAQL